MPILKSRLGDWELDHVHEWSQRQQLMQATGPSIIDADGKVATIGSCFAAELAALMGEVGIKGAMHPGGLYYTTATIRQELERMAGGWPERDAEPLWQVKAGWIDPFRAYTDPHPDEAALLEARAQADVAADALFRGAKVVVATLGLIEAWRSPATGNTYRQIPHPEVFPTLRPAFHRLTVAEMISDLERIRHVVREFLGAELVVTTSPVPLHSTFTALDVRIANTESKSRIRAAVSEFIDAYPDCNYFHSYEMVTTAERQSDFFREDGRHVHHHAVKYIISEFIRLYGNDAIQMKDVDSSWLSPITKTAATPERQKRPKPPKPPRSLPRRLASSIRRQVRSAVGKRGAAK